LNFEENILLSSNAKTARLLDVWGISSKLKFEDQCALLKERFRNTLGTGAELSRRTTSCMGRIAICLFMAEVETFLQEVLKSLDGWTRPQPAVFNALSLPDIHRPLDQSAKATDKTFLGSPRLLGQTMYQFARDFFGLNLYDDEAWAEVLKKPRVKMVMDRYEGLIEPKSRILLRGIALVSGYFGQVYEEQAGRATSFLSLRRQALPAAAAPAKEMLANQVRLCTQPEGLVSFAGNDSSTTAPATTSGVNVVRVSQEMLNVMLGLAVVADPALLKAALAFDDEVIDPRLDNLFKQRLCLPDNEKANYEQDLANDAGLSVLFKLLTGDVPTCTIAEQKIKNAFYKDDFKYPLQHYHPRVIGSVGAEPISICYAGSGGKLGKRLRAKSDPSNTSTKKRKVSDQQEAD